MRRAKVRTWQQISAALEKAFRGLPIQRGTGAGIPYEFLIPDIPRQLILIAHGSPNSRAKTVSAVKGLLRLAKSSRSTIKAIEGLSQNANGALNYRAAALKELIMKLRILHAAAEIAAVEMAKTKGRAGRPNAIEPSQAKKITQVVARHYRGLTGKKPTRYGPFVKILRAVFETLNVEASADAQAAALPAE